MHRFDELTWPVPVFLIDGCFSIEARSTAAKEDFPACSTLVELADSYNRDKFERLLSAREGRSQGEVALFMNGKPDPVLMDVSASWSDVGIGTVVCQPKDSGMQRIEEQLTRLRTRLHTTDMALLEEKELAESRLQEIRERSAPFTSLGAQRGLVSLFGDLNEAKVEAVTGQLLRQISTNRTAELIMDFTPLTSVEETGVARLKSLIQAISIMGISVTVSGVAPDKVRALKGLLNDPEIRFIQRIQDVI